MEENKIRKDLNKFETEQSKAVESKDVKERTNMPSKKPKKKTNKPKKPVYKRIKHSDGSVTYTRRKKPLTRPKKKKKR